jgi:hypothetical protein
METLAGKNPREVRKALGLESISAQPRVDVPEQRYFIIHRDDRRTVVARVKGYDYAWTFATPTRVTAPLGSAPVELDARIVGDDLRISLSGAVAKMSLYGLAQSSASSLNAGVDRLAPARLMEMDASAGGRKLRIILNTVHGTARGGVRHVKGAQGFLLIKE